MSQILERQLASLCQKRLAIFHPHVIAVTGSVGKTSTREAIAAALRPRHHVRTPYKNYNNQLGVPLAILGEKSPGKNLWEWLKLFVRARRSVIPDMLVLEYGADRPGDIGKLRQIAEPEVAVVTAISPVHVENYPSFDALVEEKASLGDGAKKAVVLNADDHLVLLMKGRYQAGVEIVTYGYHAMADVRAENVHLEIKPDFTYEPGEAFSRLCATIRLKTGETGDLMLQNAVSDTQIHACLAAIAVSQLYGVPLQEALHGLSTDIRPVPGRLHPLAGIKGSLVLDDTYNAAPASMAAGLAALAKFIPGETGDRRIAVLGDMAELGTMTEAEHRNVGRIVAGAADVFVGVGPKMNFALEEAKLHGFPEDRLHWCADSVEAGQLLDRMVKGGDVVLIKGSQSMRMERAVKDIMAEPLRAEELLVRQESSWK